MWVGGGASKASDPEDCEGGLDPIKLCPWPLLEMDALAATLAPPSVAQPALRARQPIKQQEPG